MNYYCKHCRHYVKEFPVTKNINYSILESQRETTKFTIKYKSKKKIYFLFIPITIKEPSEYERKYYMDVCSRDLNTVSTPIGHKGFPVYENQIVIKNCWNDNIKYKCKYFKHKNIFIRLYYLIKESLEVKT